MCRSVSADAARRQWLHDRINSLPSEDLKKLYPALRRLLAEG